ncbi:MAG: mechanosensitive ion channel domain-containing protein, partial [Phycisphaerae bacterium]
DLEEESSQRATRRTAIPSLLAAANERLDAAQTELTDTGTSTNPQSELSRQSLLTAHKIVTQDEVDAYQQELRFYDARKEVLVVRRDIARRELELARQRSERWRERAASKREEEAKTENEKVRQKQQELTDDAPERIKELTAENGTLAQELAKLGSDIKASEQNVVITREDNETLTNDLEALKRRYKARELKGLIGPQLRRQRAKIRQSGTLRREFEEAEVRMAQAQVRLSEIEAELRTLLRMEQLVERELKTIADAAEQPLSATESARTRNTLEQLLTDRQDLLTKLRRDYDTYVTDLIDETVARHQLLTQLQAVANFVNKRILWIPSAAPLTQLPDISDLTPNPVILEKFFAAAQHQVRDDFAEYLFAAFVLLAWLYLQRILQRRIDRWSTLVAKPLTDRYEYTARALIATLVAAAPWPAFVAFLGWKTGQLKFNDSNIAFDVSNALSAALLFASSLFYMLQLARKLCHENGLAAAHFRWEADGLRRASRQLLWSGPWLILFTSIVYLTEATVESDWSVTVGRPAFLASMLVSAMLTWSILHPTRGALSSFYSKRKDAPLCKVRWIVISFALLIPIACAVLSAGGYHYAAIVIQKSMLQTYVCVFVLTIAYGMAKRAIFYAQRQLAVEEARRKREAAAEQAEDQESTVTPDLAINDADLNIGKIGAQTRQLLSSSMWFSLIVVLWLAWSSLLPALTFSLDIPLWTYAIQAVQGETEGGDPSVAETIVRSVTLTNLIVSILAVIFTFALARNLPGLLEIVFLRRLVLDAGTRFAITTVARYLITTVGTIVAFNAIGIGWSKVQWLAAAVTVGLGFGLQEIFANFVSGIILLVERPIRIGDTVTINGITGAVSRMQIRATTITDWDRKELVIPNREFVTGSFVNWSLSDQILRLVISVGVAYGSDVQKVKEILLAIADDDERVLDQPKPNVWFIRFGESSLDFEVRVFVKDIDDFVLSRDAMHAAIDQAFREAAVEIAFPQRDIHIRTIHDQASSAFPTNKEPEQE